MKKVIYILAGFILLSQGIVSQNDNFITASGNTEDSYYSLNPKTNEFAAEENMIHFYLSAVLDNDYDQEGGIIARMNDDNDHDFDNDYDYDVDSHVNVSVFLYDKSQHDGIGKLIYKIFSNTSSETFSGIGEDILVNTTNMQNMLESVQVDDDHNLLTVAMAGGTGCNIGTSVDSRVELLTGSFFKCVQYSYRKYFLDDGIPSSDIPNFYPIKPVVIKIDIKNATLKRVKIPIIGELDLSKDIMRGRYAYLNVYVNDELKSTVTYTKHINVINAKMGDKITFKYPSSIRSSEPKIYGLPKVWEAAFAGDMMFHCDPNFGPSTINPFIGLDSRVHTLMLRPFPSDYQVFEEGWTQEEGGGEYYNVWDYTAQRRTNSYVVSYNPGSGYYRWPKKHIKKDGSLMDQRQNQKEGLNMKFLYHWNEWKHNTFYGFFAGIANYMMGFDDDELAYFNHRFKETGNSHPITTNKANGGVAKLERMFWKEMPEGPSIYDSTTGYPSEGHPLNIMVNAFRKNQNAKNKHLNAFNRIPSHENIDYQPYYGYEIQDKGTNDSHPNGAGITNLKHPGLVTIVNGTSNSALRFKLNITSPLDNDRGFYGSLIGPDAPASGEQNVKYYVTGVHGKTAEEQRKYMINYKYMNRLGVIRTKSHSMYDIINTPEDNKFNLEPSSYAWVTATYQRTTESKPVIVAGKELNQIFLKFCGIKTLNDNPFPEGKGHGIEIWQEDFRNNQQGEYIHPRVFGGSTKYIKHKSYVFRKGDKVTFTTFDGDPHRFDNDEEEWYLSNRSMAKRVKGSLLYNNYYHNSSYLQYGIAPVGESNVTFISNGREGKDFTYTFNQTGNFHMTVVYRHTSRLNIDIKVIEDLPQTVSNGAGTGANYTLHPEGKIVERNLTSDEWEWLIIDSNINPNYKAYVVSDVYTEFKRKNGHRSYEGNERGNKLANRWSKYNDYADGYTWYNISDNDGLTIVNQGRLATRFINSYETDMASATSTWVWKDWANHYSSVWKGKLKIGTLDGLPPYVANNTVTRLNILSDLDTNFGTYIDNNIFADGVYQNQKKAPWQFVIPLMSTTKYYGYRQRTNPSCIYYMRKVFDEDNGAFSGDPNPDSLNPDDIQAPDTSDEIKNKQDFYYNLKNNRILILSSPLREEYIVFNSNPVSGGSNTKIINQQSFGSSSNAAAKRQIKESDTTNNINSEIPVEYSGTVVLYPNPSSGIVDIIFGNKWNHSSIEVRVFDSVGREVFIQQIKTPEGSSSVTVNLSSLKSGYYILKGSSENDSFVRKIIIE